MSIVPPNQPSVNPNPSGLPEAKTEVAPPLDEQLRIFWEKNHRAIYVGCVLVLLAIIGRYTYEMLAAQREAGVEAAYAAAVTSAQWQAFARENGSHPLAGAAWLKLADEAYAAGNFTEARADYDKAAAVLPGTPFATRALVGKAMCEIQSGRTTEGTAILRQMANDSTQLLGVRCEAAYHLASLAFDAGSFDDVVKLTDLIMQVDSSGTWAQRALLLRAQTPVPVASAAPEQKGEAAPEVSVKLPGS
ncbi:MAG: tetratricopeptide repeat protein [Opitutaceae bacterium]|nr:tetratricopeptide repeat protein [Opitutaceae bacterium]